MPVGGSLRRNCHTKITNYNTMIKNLNKYISAGKFNMLLIGTLKKIKLSTTVSITVSTDTGHDSSI